MTKWILPLLFIVTSNSAIGQSADAGLVNLISGDVTYSPQGGTHKRPIQPYMKLRFGDHIFVAAGGQVRVVFLDNARQELWIGPAGFITRKTEAEPISGKATTISILPTGVAQAMTKVPDLIQYAKLGGIQVRGLTRQQEASLEQQTKLAQARMDYEKMRTEMPADDITPELFLYSALYEFLVYDEMKKVVEEMLRKQPNNEDARALRTWVAGKSAR